jgi:MoaA/NifB/PqqE/SkfB family radical SAM enzyme
MINLNSLNESNSFCSIPFVHQEKHFHNHHNICCYSNVRQSDDLDDNSLQSFNSKKMFHIRNKMLEGQKPQECNDCYNQEAQGLVSPRQRETQGWVASKNFAEALQQNIIKFLNAEQITPISYDLRYSNTCTLKCRMCNPYSSSSINAENKKLVKIWSEKFNYVDNPRTNHDVVIDNNIKKIYLAGGEPLIEPYNLSFLKNLSDVNPDVKLIISTSLNNLSDEIRETLDKFANLLLVVSIDGVNKLNSYIRHGSVWESIIKNLDLVKKHEIMFATTTSLYNVLDIPNIVTFFSENFPEYFHSIFLVNNEEELFVENLPYEFRPELIAQLENMLETAPTSTHDGISNIIKTLKINNYDPKRFTKFIKYTKILDEARGESILDIQPKFKNYFTE